MAMMAHFPMRGFYFRSAVNQSSIIIIIDDNNKRHDYPSTRDENSSRWTKARSAARSVSDQSPRRVPVYSSTRVVVGGVCIYHTPLQRIAYNKRLVPREAPTLPRNDIGLWAEHGCDDAMMLCTRGKQDLAFQCQVRGDKDDKVGW